MKFEKESKVSHPAAVVFETMLGDLEGVVPFLPSVESIERQSYDTADDGTVHVVRRWQGTADSAPKAVRPFLSKESMAWLDDATWYPDEWKVEWTLSTKLSGLYTCNGVNYFEPDAANPEGTTRMRITGDLIVYPDKLPGVPKFLGKRLAPQVEKFVVNLITPNLTDVATGLQGYLDDKGDA